MQMSILYASQANASKVANGSMGCGVSSASMYPNSFPHQMLIMLYRNNPKLAKGLGFYKSMNAMLTLLAHIMHECHEHYRYFHEMCKKNNIKAVAKSPEVKEGDSCSVQSDISSL